MIQFDDILHYTPYKNFDALMSAISVRLPEDLDRALSAEARRLHKRRSELVREAVREYVQRQAKQRFMNDMVAEMRAWLGDETARRESRDLAEQIADDDVDAIIASESKADTGSDSRWWK